MLCVTYKKKKKQKLMIQETGEINDDYIGFVVILLGHTVTLF